VSKLQRLLTRTRGTLVLNRGVLAELHRSGWDAYPNETGGVLLGHQTPADRFGAVVRHLVGPGPAAVHKPRRFEPDHEWQAAQVAQLWTRDQSLEYLGDWHTHPSGSVDLSPMDRDALRVIAASPDADQPHPVMLVVALHPNRSRLGATLLSDGRVFKALRLAIQARPPGQVDP
jgi:integrative and conjugative element protein (TIGR02256 family)